MTFDFVVPDILPTEGVQKIAGFSRGHHHRNSIRLGINRSVGEPPRLWMYAYVNGQRMQKLICKAKAGTKLFCCLQLCHVLASAVVSSIEGMDEAHYDHAKARLFPIGYRLKQYFEFDGQNLVQINS
jgi:hypothetical protein